MIRTILFLLLVLPLDMFSQQPPLFLINKDSSAFSLTTSGATKLALLPLKCMEQEFPNKTSHTSYRDSDHVLLPRQLHPTFYGCFDWHSSVHGHWMLIRLLKLFPDLPEAGAIRKAINRTITIENIEQELRYFDIPLTGGWERTYGWAWLLKLDEELLTWTDPDAEKWHQALQPLMKKIISLWQAFLPKQTYANRTGVHPNTAFGLVFAFDYAKTAGLADFEKAIRKTSLFLFAKDKKAPVSWEPNGSDFLSPSLEEADLMRRILSPAEFNNWFRQFLTAKDIKHLSVLPVVSDRTDLQIVHLDGLCFSRSWCMQGLASVLGAKDPLKKTLQKAAIQHLAAALPNVVSGHYGGEHWLASFAVYALTQHQQ
ncbi:MAG TPA: DUF2891 domain-containing protein [Chitinophagaceae bacterium]|nr:DUF2891 domain-containing protein [Chitinophagaceae bacterium]